MSDPSTGDGVNDGYWRAAKPRWAVLDPAGTRHGSVFPTVYVADELLIRDGTDNTNYSEIQRLAARAGWIAEERALSERAAADTGSDEDVERGEGRFPGASTTVRMTLRVEESQQSEVVAETPDAWQLLRQARRDGIADGVSLNHVLLTDSFGVNPFKANPFKANPFKANPFKANPFKANAAGVGVESYAAVGFGGRQPVTFLGSPPQVAKGAKTRPVVAVFDTGCGPHPWFGKDVLLEPVLHNGENIGLEPHRDPGRYPSHEPPLEGWIDDAAGHGTFIAGIVRQECPDARILPVRIADGEGVIIESELIASLGRLVTYIDEGARVDVLNLSFGFFPESPNAPETISELGVLLERLRELGCVVVCSAGNESTDRPTYPAALGGGSPIHVAIGALNPSDRSVALFSNVGTWVTAYAPGVGIVSTIPVAFDGGVQAGIRDDLYGRRRETLDIDDFRGGFAVWSGTSFAAPVAAGRIAAALQRGADPKTATSEVIDALRKADHSPLR